MSFKEPKLSPEAQSDKWGSEAQHWAKRKAKEITEEKRGDFLIVLKTLADGTVVKIMKWGDSRHLAEVIVENPEGGRIVYRAKYKDGMPTWLKVLGGPPENFPPDPDAVYYEDKLL